jgi:uncharacterized SAM-binding protein YcdF (DUF218 family)
MTDIELAKIIWDYHHVNHKLEKADGIFVLGSHDIRVAEYGAQLYLEEWAPILIMSGGVGRLTEGMWQTSEAELFASIAVRIGVPKERIVVESRSTNTGENIRFTKALLEEKGILIKKLILVQKPYMERRTYATFMKQWEGMDFLVTSPQISFEEYPNDEIPLDNVISIVVGDLQRIRDYPKLGFQIEQEIPANVWDAYEELVHRGYTRHLI